jgi:glyoxylase I family protein
MQLTRFHHVAVIASDFARSKRFYHEILGLPILRESYRADRDSHKLDLELPDGSQIELFSFPVSPPRPSYPEALGARHFAFATPDLDAVVAHLRAHEVGVEDIRTDPLTNCRYVFFKDPDDLPIEVYEEEGK